MSKLSYSLKWDSIKFARGPPTFFFSLRVRPTARKEKFEYILTSVTRPADRLKCAIPPPTACPHQDGFRCGDQTSNGPSAANRRLPTPVTRRAHRLDKNDVACTVGALRHVVRAVPAPFVLFVNALTAEKVALQSDMCASPPSHKQSDTSNTSQYRYIKSLARSARQKKFFRKCNKKSWESPSGRRPH